MIKADEKLLKTQVEAAADKATAAAKTEKVRAEATADVHKAAAKH
jgi:colicin import membrane protein